MRTRNIKLKVVFIFLSIILFGVYCESADTIKLKTSYAEGKTFTDNPKDKLLVKEDELKLRANVESLISAIVNKNVELILAQVNDVEGIEVDAKATVTKNKFAQMILDENSNLNILLWNAVKLKEKNPDIKIATYQNIFKYAEDIKIHLFFYNSRECEVQLLFKNKPSAGVMGNPIYHKIEGKWFLRRFF